MKRWQLEVIVVIVVELVIWLFTGWLAGGILGVFIIWLPAAWVGGKLWDKYWAKYECTLCTFKGQTKEETRVHIAKKHGTKIKPKAIKKKAG